jgi:molybdopterin/thiamine biosynthesis adenylyltransferase
MRACCSVRVVVVLFRDIDAPESSEILARASFDLVVRLGAETTAKLIQMNVLIVGMRGVGIETAKNLLLQGVGAVTV